MQFNQEEIKLISVGITEIDQDHQVFTGKITELLAACKKKDVGSQTLAEMLMFLKTYVREHFMREEQLMKTFDYPGLAVHAAQHASLRKRLVEIYAEQKRVNFSSYLMVELNTFLVDWLVHHIKTEDARMSRFFLKHNIPAKQNFKIFFAHVSAAQ